MGVIGMGGSLRRSLYDEPDLVWTTDHDWNQSRLDEEPRMLRRHPVFR